MALFELSKGLDIVAGTLRWDGDIGDTTDAFVALGPLFGQLGAAMRQLPGPWGSLGG